MPAATDDLRIKQLKELTTPEDIIAKFPRSEAATRTVTKGRKAISSVLRGSDDRLVVIVGPCSIHDPDAALEYAARLAGLRKNLCENLIIVMRVYFEKPRTTVGWKGLINDPNLDGSFNINDGLGKARRLLAEIGDMGLPAGSEFLDMTTPQYIADLVSWAAIGARTTESQIHRELASGLSCPVGFKNGTGGDIKIACDAVKSAAGSHHFLAVTKQGHAAIAETSGNPDCHVILRGGSAPNYDAASVDAAATSLMKSGLPQNLMIDASHANSGKRHENQPNVTRAIGEQIAAGDHRIMGVMIESNLVAGRQDIVPGVALTYGQSVTDACVNWETTVEMLADLAECVRDRRAQFGGQRAISAEEAGLMARDA